MNHVHQILVKVPFIKKARSEAFAQLARHLHEAPIVDKRIPAGRAGASLYGTPEFVQSLNTVRMLQASSLLSVYTMLANTYGLASAKDFEEMYLHNPGSFKKVISDSFKFMGECAADVVIERRNPKAVDGEDSWDKGEFDYEGFLEGLAEMCKLKKLLAGDYFTESYFLNTLTNTAHIPSEPELAQIATDAKAEGCVIALVPVCIEF